MTNHMIIRFMTLYIMNLSAKYKFWSGCFSKFKGTQSLLSMNISFIMLCFPIIFL